MSRRASLPTPIEWLLLALGLAFVHARLRELGWKVPYTYPGRSPVQTERLLRVTPEGPHALLLTREGRVLFETSLGSEASFETLLARIRGA